MIGFRRRRRSAWRSTSSNATSAETRSTAWSAATCLEGVREFLREDDRRMLMRPGFTPPRHCTSSRPATGRIRWGGWARMRSKASWAAAAWGSCSKHLIRRLNRNVAIKVLSASLATTGTARSRFLREARAAAAVVHEHVVGVFAVDEAAGMPFLVMEYVSGRSLQDRLDRDGPLSVKEVLRIGMQTAAGLAAAHAQGLVHRDVKPANILLENSVERVRLTDFGLARAVADAGMSHSGVVAGTPYYMAPEQARGETTDHRADLFSLGSTLYAICAGHPPFRAETPLAVLRRVCDEAPRPLREINPEIPAWLEALIARLMAKDPSQRYQTADEAFDVLKKCLAHVQQPLSSPLPPGLDTLRRAAAWTRARRDLAALAVVLVAGAAVTVKSYWKNRSPKPETNATAQSLCRPRSEPSRGRPTAPPTNSAAH